MGQWQLAMNSTEAKPKIKKAPAQVCKRLCKN
jgi:hypothetical protein